MTDAEIDNLEAGMIVLYRGARGLRPRIVRSVHRHNDGRVRSINVVKLRCSQYPSALTILLRSDMRPLLVWTGLRAKTDKPLDAQINAEALLGRYGVHASVTCSMTQGAYI